MNAIHCVFSAGLAAVLLGGCAADPARPTAAAGSRGDACMFESAVSGFEPVDMTRLIIRGIGRDHAYLAEVSAGCFDLEHRWALALIDGDSNGQICGFGRDSVAYRDGLHIDECRILKLDRLTPAQLETLKSVRGRRKPDKPAATGTP